MQEPRKRSAIKLNENWEWQAISKNAKPKERKGER
jgi:hypothetical protein